MARADDDEEAEDCLEVMFALTPLLFLSHSSRKMELACLAILVLETTIPPLSF